MSKKIVVITGSPRKDGNTFRMAEACIACTAVLGGFNRILKEEIYGTENTQYV